MSATLKAKATLDDSPFQTSLRRMASRSATVGKAIGRGFKASAVTGVSVLGIAGAAAAGGMAKLTYSAINGAAALKKVSRMTGLSVKELAILEDSFEENGFSLTELSGALTTLQDRMSKADGVTKAMRDHMAEMGINVEDFLKAAPSAKFIALAKGISATEDSTKRLGAATTFFGRAGKQLIPVLDDVAGLDLSALDKEAEAIDRMADSSTRAKKGFARLYDGVSRFGVGLADKIADPLADGIEKLEKKLGGAQKAGEWVGDVALWAAGKKPAAKEIAPMVSSGRDPWSKFTTAHSRKSDFLDYAGARSQGISDPSIKAPRSMLQGASMAGPSFGAALASAGRGVQGASMVGAGVGGSRLIRRGDANRAKELKRLEDLAERQTSALEELNKRTRSWDE